MADRYAQKEVAMVTIYQISMIKRQSQFDVLIHTVSEVHLDQLQVQQLTFSVVPYMDIC